ncbi:hypothetical protein FP2506_03384 [Fulvimarina pelagi HTCC2506]|uniref:Uncharacterized protein n=2 Tax=Fulvimarina pelagi TaxID=217511 RepID=Q0G056_9HYPH|nr:hypothetical protein [Fulvimarina pelagi]EAU40737.1 hypothetical protein FP2506_03384 [Fulvimarina pelagi HTCC2506]BAT31279.1 hypothetical protein [Fulvimarina pelagi]
MVEVTNELMTEILKSLQQRISNIELLGVEQAQGMNAIRGYAGSIQADTTNIYGVLSRIDQRLDRIERRLELREMAEPGTPYSPNA